MKSIMEEASSIMKAIEKCWQRAERPQEFSIKILEKPEKNFFGFTTKPAKVVLFYHNSAMRDSTQKPIENQDSRSRYRKPYRKYYNQNNGHNQRYRSGDGNNRPLNSKYSIKKQDSMHQQGSAPRFNNQHGNNNQSSSS